MNRWTGIALVIVALAGGVVVQAGEIVDEKVYGNCSVWTDINPVTNRENHILACRESGSVEPAIALVWNRAVASVHLATGAMCHAGDVVQILWRFTPGTGADYARCSVDGNMATLADDSYFDIFLDELPAASSITIKASRPGSKEVTIFLEGTAAAVQDFRVRIAQPL